jgi:hypothetical protein
LAGGSAQLTSLSPLPPPFCNDENNSVIRSAMGALRNSKKNCLLAIAILFLFTFFNLILEAPHTQEKIDQRQKEEAGTKHSDADFRKIFRIFEVQQTFICTVKFYKSAQKFKNFLCIHRHSKIIHLTV